MGTSLNNTQESYARLASSRRWRRGARGFRLCPRNRFSVRRLRAQLLTFLGLVGRYVRLLASWKLSSKRSSGCGGARGGRSGSRRVLVGAGNVDAASFMRTNSFYSQAIADCLEFIKRNSVPVEDDNGSVSAAGR